MIKKLQFYVSNSIDPYYNLALEQVLFNNVDDDALILYLWQNQNAVVIGRNQNAYSECRTELLKEDGCLLVRRTSGGGAVFHDLGNLNFTFICSSENLDIQKHMQVIREACRLANIEAEISGRNDILADGKKFSGNAFYNSKGRSYHHGTILINSDIERLSRYLTPPKAKLETKGVKSVRARVINLSELVPSLTCDTMKGYLFSAAEDVYNISPEFIDEMRDEQISDLYDHFRDPEYIYGLSIPFNASCKGQSCFGNIELKLCVKNGYITDLVLFTDSLDPEMPDVLRETLISVPFDLSSISSALLNSFDKVYAESIIALLNEQIFS